MTIISTIIEQKTHVIYIVLLLVAGSIGYHFFAKTPSEIIKTRVETKIETKIVNKDIVRNKLVYVDRVTEIKKANGDLITITDHSHSDSKVTDTTKIVSKSEEKVSITEVTKFMKNYTIDVMYPISIKDISSPIFNPLDLQVLGGIRLFSLPIFATVGTNIHLNQIIVGARIEF